MAKERKAVYTGPIAQDDEGNYFCGEYLLDYQQVVAAFKPGDEIDILSVIENPSDKSYDRYPKKSKNFMLANKSKFIR